MGDKVLHPKNSSRPAGLKFGSTAAIKGPNPTVANASPYNRKGSK